MIISDELILDWYFFFLYKKIEKICNKIYVLHFEWNCDLKQQQPFMITLFVFSGKEIQYVRLILDRPYVFKGVPRDWGSSGVPSSM